MVSPHTPTTRGIRVGESLVLVCVIVWTRCISWLRRPRLYPRLLRYCAGVNSLHHRLNVSLEEHTVFPRIIAGAIIWGRRLFQILLTGSRALHILLYYAFKSKNNHTKLTEHGLFKWLFLRSAFMDHIAFTLDRERIKGREDVERGVGRRSF